MNPWQEAAACVPFSLADCHAAWQRARRGKRPTSHNQLAFEARRPDRLQELHTALRAGQWQLGRTVSFVVTHSKTREIHAPCFADRVVHDRQVVRLELLFDPVLIHDSIADRRGKGSYAAVYRLQAFMRARQNMAPAGGGWSLQLDIHNCFNTVHGPTLYKLLCDCLALAEGVASMTPKPVLHGDNGSTLKATTVLAMLNWLGVKPSYSRPRVSDDNAFAESLFRTAKYRPEFPAKGFADLDAAQSWAADFVRWYNVEHRHSGIRYVSPAQRHEGHDKAILAARHALYLQAQQRNPAGWSGSTRNWAHIRMVALNPERDTVVNGAGEDQHTQRQAA